MARTVTIKASDVAACIGLNPYKPPSEVRDELWKKHWPETFTGRTKHDLADEALGRSGAARSVLASAVSFQAASSAEALKNFEQARDKIASDQTISHEDRAKIVEHLRSKCFTVHGTRSEDKTAQKVTEDTGARLVRDNTFYKLIILETPECVFNITGRVDRIEEGPDGSRTLVEIKNRTRGFFRTLKEYENIQVQVYLQMLGLVHAKLIEQYNSQTNTVPVERDEELWANVIMPGLENFCTDLLEKVGQQ